MAFWERGQHRGNISSKVSNGQGGYEEETSPKLTSLCAK